MRTLLTLLLLALPAVAAPVPKALKKNPHPLNGKWVVVEWHTDEARLGVSDTIYWTIDGDSLSVRGVRDEVPEGFLANVSRTITRPDGGADNAIDFNIAFADGSATIRRPAVIDLDGDRLSLCMSDTHNGTRPAECKPARGTIMYVLKRSEK
jgi:uncharacterized protein (TIGR03067 family)